jgi:hypothetical protein
MNQVLKDIWGTWRDDEPMGWGEVDKNELHSRYVTLHTITFRAKLNQEESDRQNMLKW